MLNIIAHKYKTHIKSMLKPIKTPASLSVKALSMACTRTVYAQASILVNLIVVNVLLVCWTLLEMAPPVLDHLWTQDSLISYLVYRGALGPYIDQGRSKTRVWNFEQDQNLTTFNFGVSSQRTCPQEPRVKNIGPFKGLHRSIQGPLKG